MPQHPVGFVEAVLAVVADIPLGIASRPTATSPRCWAREARAPSAR